LSKIGIGLIGAGWALGSILRQNLPLSPFVPITLLFRNPPDPTRALS
jgi:hypothetical protein